MAAALWVTAAGCASIVGLDDPKPGTPTIDGNGCARACDLEDNCGCSAGATCTWNGTTGEPFCRATAGASKLGESCAKDDDCEAGTSCVFGVCRRYCTGDGQCGSTTCTA